MQGLLKLYFPDSMLTNTKKDKIHLLFCQHDVKMSTLKLSCKGVVTKRSELSDLTKDFSNLFDTFF